MVSPTSRTADGAVGLDGLRAGLLAEHTDTLDAARLDVIADELRRMSAESIRGDVVELGCYRGAMALWMRAVLDDAGDRTRTIRVYDSFQGLPAPGDHDDPTTLAGVDLSAAPVDVRRLHTRWGRRCPEIFAGWFADTLPVRMPKSIAFAYLDGDYYSSIMVSLEHVVPRLAPGASLIVDDYADTIANPAAWNGLPGVKAACDDYFGSPGSLAVLFGPTGSDLAFGRHTRAAVSER
jgi:O-methyltransferase